MFDSVFEGAGVSLIATIRASQEECARLNNRWVCTEHLLWAIATDCSSLASRALSMMKIDAAAIQAEVERQLKEKNESEAPSSNGEKSFERLFGRYYLPARTPTSMPGSAPAGSSVEPSVEHHSFSGVAAEALTGAEDYCRFFGLIEVKPEHLLLAMIDNQEAGAVKVLEEIGANLTFLKRQIMVLMAEEVSMTSEYPPLRTAVIGGLKNLIDKYQRAVSSLSSLSYRSRNPVQALPTHGEIVHMVCIAYVADFLFTQVAFRRYLLEETLKSLTKRTGPIDQELTASIVSTSAQNLRGEVRGTIEYLFSHEYRLLTQMLDEAEYDLIGSVIEDLWWAQSEEIALQDLFADAIEDHRRKHLMNLQKRRIEISQRLTKLKTRLDDTIRQCFVKRSIPA